MEYLHTPKLINRNDVNYNTNLTLAQCVGHSKSSIIAVKTNTKATFAALSHQQNHNFGRGDRRPPTLGNPEANKSYISNLAPKLSFFLRVSLEKLLISHPAMQGPRLTPKRLQYPPDYNIFLRPGIAQGGETYIQLRLSECGPWPA